MDDLVICTGMSVLDIPVRGLEGIDPAHEHVAVTDILYDTIVERLRREARYA